MRVKVRKSLEGLIVRVREDLKKKGETREYLGKKGKYRR
jgi:hypothetical protein